MRWPWLLMLVSTPALAQPSRGDALIDQLELAELRTRAGELARIALDNPLTREQYAKILALRQRTPALVRLGAADDADLASIATALCADQTPAIACTATIARVLQCVADRCEVAFENKPARIQDIVLEGATCKPSSPSGRSAPLGLGLEFGTGYQDSRYPRDGRAWSFGLAARLRLGHRFGLVARLDRVAGRDQGNDADDDGDDDSWSGSITRISALAGPSIVLMQGEYEDEPRYLRIDLLGGYTSTRSQVDESGPAAGIDLTYQLWIFGLGLRVVEGFGEANDTTTVIAHLGVAGGSAPPEIDDCDPHPASERSTRLAFGFDFPLLGYGIALGALTPSVGVEMLLHAHRKLDFVARGDLLLYPGYERDRTIHQALLGGIRIDHSSRPQYRSETTGWFTTIMGGYSHSAGLSPTTTGTGPVTDLGVGWGIQSRDVAGYFRLHVRFGLSGENEEYRAIFLSGGFELRLDPRSWRDRFR